MEHILHLVESVFEIATHYLGPSPLVILKLADATIVCRLCWGIFIICSVFFALNDSGFLNRMERLLLSISLSVCAAIMTPDWFVVAVAVVVCFFCRVMGGLFCGYFQR